MTKIVKTIAVAVAVTCMFAMTSGEANAQCARGGYGGFNSGVGFGNVGGVYSSGYRGNIGGFNSGFNRGVNVNFNRGSSIYRGGSLYRSPARNVYGGGKFRY